MKGRGRGRAGGGHGGGRGRGRGRGGSVTAPRSAQQAKRAANAEAGAEFNAPIREERQEVKGSRKREQDIGSWYAQLAADYGSAADAGAAALQSVQDTTTKQLAEAGARSSADQARLGAEDAGIAGLIGGPKDASGMAKIAQAGAAADRSRVALAEPVAATQANFVGRLGEQKGAARLQGIEAKGEERARRTKIKSDIAGKRQEKGAARTAALDKIREAERTYAMEIKKFALAKKEARTAAQSAAATAALARVKAAHEARQDAIANSQAQERIGISRKNAKTSARSQRVTARHYAKGDSKKGGLTTAERRARGEHSSDAMSAAKALLGSEPPPKNDREWAKFQAHLIKELGSSYSAEATRAVAKIRAVQKQQAATRSRRMHQGKVPGY